MVGYENNVVCDVTFLLVVNFIMGREKWFSEKSILYKKPNPLYAVNIIMYDVHCVCVCVCVFAFVCVWVRVVLHDEQNISFACVFRNRMKECYSSINTKGVLYLNKNHNT